MFQDIVKYGWDNIEHGILASGLTREEALNFEALLIQKMELIKNGFNRKLGPQGMCVKCVETGEMFASKNAAVQSTSSKSWSAFAKALDNPKRTCGGYHWVSL